MTNNNMIYTQQLYRNLQTAIRLSVIKAKFCNLKINLYYFVYKYELFLTIILVITMLIIRGYYCNMIFASEPLKVVFNNANNLRCEYTDTPVHISELLTKENYTSYLASIKAKTKAWIILTSPQFENLKIAKQLTLDPFTLFIKEQLDKISPGGYKQLVGLFPSNTDDIYQEDNYIRIYRQLQQLYRETRNPILIPIMEIYQLKTAYLVDNPNNLPMREYSKLHAEYIYKILIRPYPDTLEKFTAVQSQESSPDYSPYPTLNPIQYPFSSYKDLADIINEKSFHKNHSFIQHVITAMSHNKALTTNVIPSNFDLVLMSYIQPLLSGKYPEIYTSPLYDKIYPQLVNLSFVSKNPALISLEACYQLKCGYYVDALKIGKDYNYSQRYYACIQASLDNIYSIERELLNERTQDIKNNLAKLKAIFNP